MTETKTRKIKHAKINHLLEKIISDSEHWDQKHWVGFDPAKVPLEKQKQIQDGATAVCGTTACMAGRAMLDSGEWYEKLQIFSRDSTTGEILDYRVKLIDSKGRTPFEAWNDDPDYNEDQDGHVAYGARYLGLPYDVAFRIFNRTDIHDAREFVAWVREQIGRYEADQYTKKQEAKRVKRTLAMTDMAYA